MNPEYKALWLSALRSGDYTQGHAQLRPSDDTYCCLGVLHDQVDGTWQIEDEQWYTAYGPGATLDDEVGEKVDLSHFDVDTLSDMNDAGKTFTEIADYIEENL